MVQSTLCSVHKVLLQTILNMAYFNHFDVVLFAFVDCKTLILNPSADRLMSNNRIFTIIHEMHWSLLILCAFRQSSSTELLHTKTQMTEIVE